MGKGHYKGNNKETQHHLNDEAHKLASSTLNSISSYSRDISPPSSVVELRCGHILTSKWQTFIQEATHSLSTVILQAAP
jgi:hypothetical protein